MEPISQRPVTLPELKELLVERIVAAPAAAEACVRILARTEGGRADLRAFADAVGEGFARRLLGELATGVWEEILSLEVPARPMPHLQRLRSALIRQGWSEAGANDGICPFAFLEDWSESELAALVLSDSPASLALMSVFLGPTKMTKILDRFPADYSRSVIGQIVALEKLPDDAVRSAARGYSESLQARRRMPSAETTAEAASVLEAAPSARPVMEITEVPVTHSFCEMDSAPAISLPEPRIEEAAKEVSVDLICALDRLRESRERELALRSFLESQRNPGASCRQLALYQGLETGLESGLRDLSLDSDSPPLAPSGVA